MRKVLKEENENIVVLARISEFPQAPLPPVPPNLDLQGTTFVGVLKEFLRKVPKTWNGGKTTLGISMMMKFLGDAILQFPGFR
jgi:hypothetical protein